MPTLVGVTVTLDGSPLAGRTVSVGADTAVTDGSGLATISTSALGPGNNVVCDTPGGESAAWTFNNASTGDSGSGSGFTAGPQNLGTKGANSTTFTLTTLPTTGTVEVEVLVNGSQTSACGLRLEVGGTYDQYGPITNALTDNPWTFEDVPATTEAFLRVFCLSNCAAEWSATWSGGSVSAQPFGSASEATPFTVVAGDTTTVTVEITCTDTSEVGSATCCPDNWWCLEAGGVGSFPVGPRPDGVTGHPMRSQTVAEARCPPASPPALPETGDCGDVTCSGPLPNEYLFVDLEVNSDGSITDDCAAGYAVNELLAEPQYEVVGGELCVWGYSLYHVIPAPYTPNGCEWTISANWTGTLNDLELVYLSFTYGVGGCSCDGVLAEVMGPVECADAECDNGQFGRQAYKWNTDTTNGGRIRIYRQDLTPPAYC